MTANQDGAERPVTQAPDCDRCGGSGLDPDRYATEQYPDGNVRHLAEPCSDCQQSTAEARAALFGFIGAGFEEEDCPSFAAALDVYVQGVLAEAAEAAPLSRYYSHEACGFHWHGRGGMDIPMRDGEPVCPRCELERLTAPSPADRAKILREGEARLRVKAQELSALAEEEMRRDLEDEAQVWHEAATELARMAALGVLAGEVTP